MYLILLFIVRLVQLDYFTEITTTTVMSTSLCKETFEIAGIGCLSVDELQNNTNNIKFY